MNRIHTTIAALATRGRLFALSGLLLATCLVPAGAPAADTHAVNLRLPSVVTIPGAARAHAETAVGHATLAIPNSWSALKSTNRRTVAHATAELAPGCRADIELRSAIEVPNEPMSVEIQQAMAFWFYSPLPAVPPPVPTVAGRAGANRDWALGTPPPASLIPQPGSPAPRTLSPYYGVLAQRLARTHVWAAVTVGVRVPAACEATLPGRPALQAAIEHLLKMATFSARLG